VGFFFHYDYDNALIYLNLAKEENNNSVDLWLTLAVCQSKKRDFRKAFESVSFAEKIQPNNPLIPFQMGTLFMQQDNNDEALKFFKKALEYNPNHIEALFHIGLIKLKQEKYQEATQYYQNRTIRKNNRIGKFNDMSLPILDKNTDLIVAWEQGIGDQILLISLIEEIKDKVKSITYISQDKLYPLLKLNYPDLTVIKESESDEFIKKKFEL
jgi:tetratricopeptide (TPR) repeat protein